MYLSNGALLKNGEYRIEKVLAAGGRFGTEISNGGSDGYYWSGSLYETPYPHRPLAFYLSFDSAYLGVNADTRDSGFSVRPVCDK